MAMRKKLVTYQRKRRALKFSMSLHAIFEKATDARITTDPPAYFTTDQYELYEGTNIDELLTSCSVQLASCIESYSAQESRPLTLPVHPSSLKQVHKILGHADLRSHYMLE